MSVNATQKSTTNQRTRILIVDEYESIRGLVGEVLSNDFDILGSRADGFAALEAVEALRPDLIILDITMPGLSGFEVARRLRDGGSQIRIVCLTVHDDVDFAREAMESGASAYVVKSRMASELRLALDEVLAGRRFISGTAALSGL